MAAQATPDGGKAERQGPADGEVGATIDPLEEDALDEEEFGNGDAEEFDNEEHRLPIPRQIGFQISLGLGSAVVITLAASLVAWLGFFRVGSLQREINEEHVPALTTAVHVAQEATTLAGAAPRLVVEAQTVNVVGRMEALNQGDTLTEIDLMESAARMIELTAQLPANDRSSGLLTFVEDLADNLRSIHFSVTESVALQQSLFRIQDRAAVLGRQWNEEVRPPLDDQLFYMATGLRELDDTPVPIEERGSEDELLRLQALSNLESRGAIALRLISDVVVQNDPQLISTIEERFWAATTEAESSFGTLGDAGLASLRTLHQEILELGEGDEGAFALRRRYLSELRSQQFFLIRNQEVTESLEGVVALLTTGLEIDARNATEASEAALNLGRTLLLALNILGVTSAALILWLFVARFLVRRLNNLSRAMRRMAGGDLETEVKVRGKDEVGEMAKALEVFRRNALEVQRLNLVEELLAREERQKHELENTLQDLRKAQDQMVMQEKLASLGQLTAGIAHEIKNPLNFVNNFADLSNGLLEDLNAELETVQEMIPEETREEISDIRSDLSGNLERINHHGKRASSIVYGMLEHARKEGGATRPTAVNSMLDEYVALAFHSMRAVDTTFQMTIEKDLADDVGEVKAVPQDLSRVFLNIVTNACQATFEKQRSPQTEAGYQPCLTVTSRRENEHVEVRIRDNGPGIPEKHLAKIFEPFFTTKDTDKGTGLGLSLSHDIVRSHGGTLEVNSTPGKGAEFIVTLPAGSRAASGNADTSQEATAGD